LTTGTTGTPVITALSSNGQLIIGSGSGAPAAATITGTANQITVTNAANSITLSLPSVVTTTTQPAFLYILSSNDTNATGDNATYTLGGGNVLTKEFDQNNNMTTGGTFTAPVTGIYQFIFNIQVNNLSSAMTNGHMTIVTTARSYLSNIVNWYAVTGNATCLNMTALANMSANDTATFTLVISNGASNAATVVAANTYVAGYLIL
jgi:hypothetical protein